MTRVCDYEGSRYRQEFWENENRRYEDLVERIAVGKLLPPSGGRILEVGAGFGRMVDMYAGYDEIVLVDYARTQLEEAQRYLGDDPRVTYVVADVFRLPFVDDLFDSLVMIRVMHHLVYVPSALFQLQRVLHADGTAVIEHASKRHLKAILRWLLRRQDWNPFDHEPHEFVALNIDFHPAWMRSQFAAAGFRIQQTRTVSHFRVPLLKRMIPASVLARLDGWAQATGNWWQLTPSIFLQATPARPPAASAGTQGLFRCPNCHSVDLLPRDEMLVCNGCDAQWGFRDGIYDFKNQL